MKTIQTQNLKKNWHDVEEPAKCFCKLGQNFFRLIYQHYSIALHMMMRKLDQFSIASNIRIT
jgi:hypothetical protein